MLVWGFLLSAKDYQVDLVVMFVLRELICSCGKTQVADTLAVMLTVELIMLVELGTGLIDNYSIALVTLGIWSTVCKWHLQEYIFHSPQLTRLFKLLTTNFSAS